MAGNKNNKTIFQRLGDVLSTNGGFVANADVLKNPTDALKAEDPVIATASSKEEYDKKLLQMQQQAMLAKQWVKTGLDLNTQSMASLNDVKMMYRDADLMDAFPEIGAALDITSEESCFIGSTGSMVNIFSKSQRIKSFLEDLFVNRLSIHTVLPMICRSMCKYGNTFMLLNINEQNGVMGWKQLPVYEIERWENGMNTPFASKLNINNVDEKTLEDAQFVWLGQNEYIPYKNWQIAHFRLLYDSMFLPYGISYLNKARRHFRMLSMMEDMMLIYRLDRSIERRVFKINVGAIDADDVGAFIQEVSNQFKRKPVVDPLTGQVDLRKSFMNVTEDYFVPTRSDNATNPIETLSGAQNLTAMDDIKFVQNKVLSALRVPKSFLNFEETEGDGKNLSLMDVRFTRTVNRIQQALLMELNKIAIIHLYINGFRDDLTNFTLTMNNPSSQTEMLELENLAKKITTAKDAVSDPGGGMPILSCVWVWKNIFHFSDKEIKQNLEEIRLETALAAELQKTMQIIKRTGIFDGVDNIYGETGAQYTEDGAGGEEGGGMPGGGGGGGPLGGPPVGMGDMDFGDEGPDMEMGNEGEMDMGTVADEEGAAMPPPDGGEGGPPPNIMDSLLRRTQKEIINEQKRLGEELKKRNKHYHEILQEKLLKNNTTGQTSLQKADIYDKAFFVNEELDNMKHQLDDLTEK